MQLTFCMLGNFSCFCCHLLTFSKFDFFKKFFQEHYQSVKRLQSTCMKYYMEIKIRHFINLKALLQFSLLTICMLGNFPCFYCRLLTFFEFHFFKNFFQEHYQSVKQFGSRSGTDLTFCQSRSGSKLFAKFISKRQVAPNRQKISKQSFFIQYKQSLIQIHHIKYQDIISIFKSK